MSESDLELAPMPEKAPDVSGSRARGRSWWHTFVECCRVVLAAALIVSGVAVGIPLVMRLWVQRQARPHVYRSVSDVPARRVAVVFGAAVYQGDRLSPMLRDRVETAVDLYRAGKVQKILMSGDNRFVHYNEPGAMVKHAAALGVPLEDLQPDYAGRRTYDTCYRARDIFGVDGAVLVTQGFHLSRAVYTCRSLKIDAVGMVAARYPYTRLTELWYEMREVLATSMAWWDLHVRHPQPVLGDPIPLG